MSIDLLRENLKLARQQVEFAEKAILDYECAPENNIYDSLERACELIEGTLYSRAHIACELAGHCGNDEYHQDFIVDNKLYRATLDVRYNRHDKTYYYIDDTFFDYKLIIEMVKSD